MSNSGGCRLELISGRDMVVVRPRDGRRRSLRRRVQRGTTLVGSHLHGVDPPIHNVCQVLSQHGTSPKTDFQAAHVAKTKGASNAVFSVKSSSRFLR
jgi:hypothetical protein